MKVVVPFVPQMIAVEDLRTLRRFQGMILVLNVVDMCAHVFLTTIQTLGINIPFLNQKIYKDDTK